MAAPESLSYVHSIRVDADHPAFAGHFPGMPILPGAALLEAALHLIEADLSLDLTEWQLASAKFLEGVRPGDDLTVQHGGAATDAVRFVVRIADRSALVGTLSRLPAGAPP